MKKTILALFIALSSAFTMSAQSLTELEWSDLGISFKAVSDAEVVANDGYHFLVEHESFSIELQVADATGATGEQLVELLVAVAEQNGLTIDENTEVQQFKGTGCAGISLEGSRGGDNICCAVIGSTRSDLVVYVKIIYGNGYEAIANKMINSIKMNQ